MTSPYETGTSPVLAIFGISIIFFSIGLFPSMKSLGGKQYGLIFDSRSESSTSLFS
ncbi:Uncharacterised protein [uncultured archaeon]|nr:Uncharacterised protein [uncultured archaeon]